MLICITQYHAVVGTSSRCRMALTTAVDVDNEPNDQLLTFDLVPVVWQM